MRLHFPKAFLNPTSFLGAVVATVSLGASTFALCLDLIGIVTRPYQGILTFFVFPAFLVLGLSIIALGAIFHRRRLRRGGEPVTPFPTIDLNDPRKRRFYIAFGSATLVILLLSILGSYRAYEFSESVTFCGQLCHQVMEPEFTAYQGSPHARVKCVDCHVGPGAEWYVKAKFSGLYQIYATLANKYPRPIPTPIESLRPAQETCEGCHWPEKFWGAQLSSKSRFGYDPLNSSREILMLVKTGGGSPTHGPSEGIHWHMNIANRIEYAARDRHRMEIPWIQVTSPDGKTTVFTDSKAPPTEEELKTLEKRRMDCMDCHNRPSHIYLSPEEAVDLSFQTGALDLGIPYLKEAAVEALSAEYGSVEEADGGIEARLREYYGKVGPALAGDAVPALPEAAEELRRIYRKNFFPAMKTDWSSYPNQIGHRLFPGCFRCHDDRHVSPEGKAIQKRCEICHLFLTRSKEGKEEIVPVSSTVAFAHPFKSEKHFEKECWNCHTGKSSPYGTCGRCHEIEEGRPMAFACTSCHKPLKVVPGNGDCIPCHDPAKSKLHSKAAHQDCLACHREHEWKAAVAAEACSSGECHKPFKADSHYPGKECGPCHDPEFKGGKEFIALPYPAGKKPRA